MVYSFPECRGNDSAFSNLIDMFSPWIERIGLLVAFAGAIKLALSIKDEDAKERTLALLTMVAGFMIASVDSYFHIFDISPDISATTSYNNLINFVSKWVRRIGAFVMFFGGVEFGLSVRNNDAGLKVTAIKGFVTGAVIAALSLTLSTI